MIHKHIGMDSSQVLVATKWGHVVHTFQIIRFISLFSKLSRVQSWFLRANKLCSSSTRQDSSSGTGAYFILFFTTEDDKMSISVSHSFAILQRFLLKTVLLSIMHRFDNTLTDSFLQFLIICENLTVHYSRLLLLHLSFCRFCHNFYWINHIDCCRRNYNNRAHRVLTWLPLS